jgi:hypothetical protein
MYYINRMFLFLYRFALGNWAKRTTGRPNNRTLNWSLCYVALVLPWAYPLRPIVPCPGLCVGSLAMFFMVVNGFKNKAAGFGQAAVTCYIAVIPERALVSIGMAAVLYDR